MNSQFSHHLELIASHPASGIIITDPTGRAIWVNEETERMTGYSLDEFLGHMPGELLHGPGTSPERVEKIRTAIRQQEPFETILANYTKNGMLFWVRINCDPFFDSNGNLEGFIANQVDVTALIRLSDFNALLAAVNKMIAKSNDDLHLFQAICDLAVKHAHLELAWIARPDKNDRLVFLAKSGQAISYLEDFTISVDPNIPEGQGPSGMTWRTGKPHYSQAFQTNPSLKAWQQRAKRFGLDASATMPIFRNGEVWAVMSVYHARSGIFDDELCKVLDTLAEDISHGLSQIDLRKREHDLTIQLHEEKELAQVTLMSIHDAVVTTDEIGQITFLNPKALELTGWSESEALGRPVTEVITIQEDTEDKQTLDPVRETISRRTTCNLGNNTILLGRTGFIRHIETTASPIFNPQGELRGCVVILRDVSEHYEANQKLEWRANHDVLTSLPNRFALGKRLEASINNARINGHHIAVGLLDLDDFKDVNDQYGHETGDQLLIKLTQRLRTRMRDCDFLARLAGDELVVVIDWLDARLTSTFLDDIFARLHEAVETPFDIGPDEKVMVRMSMGVALYPQDGEDADGLIRQADAAMYASKSNKYNRPTWWRHSELSLSNRVKDEPLDPYGPIASDLLTKALPLFKETEEEFVELFYKMLERLPTASRILKLMSEDEMNMLKMRQSEHLNSLILPTLSLDQHHMMSTHIGQMHAMAGIETSDIMAAIDDYGRLLRFTSQKLPWRIDARLALDSIMQSRLANEIKMQSKGRDEIQRNRVANLTNLELSFQEWIDDGSFASKLAQHLAELPCIRDVMIGRPDENDKLILEFKAGKVSSLSASTIEQSTHIWKEAWLSGQIMYSESPIKDTKPDQNILPVSPKPRSAVYIPILDRHGHSIIMIILFGAYPAQFAQPLMRMWIESVQHMITPVFLRMEKVAKDPIDAETRQHYHNLLFTDHLQIVVQPILNLATGEIKKIEVLARLRDGDQLINPAAFLPTFGKQDLQALFVKGLRQAMDWMVRWDQQGLQLDVNLNLPPSVLISPDCPLWVKQELDAHGLQPNRLYLELLETEDDAVASEQRDEAISRLAEIGIRLVMDDLGAGYSSLQRLRKLPFHTVKIDQQLVRNAPSDPTKTIPFIASLVDMAHAIDLEVVIEGLETVDMLDMAARLGTEYGQGYALCKPLLPEDLGTWVSDWHASSLLDDLNTPLGKMTNALINH